MIGWLLRSALLLSGALLLGHSPAVWAHGGVQGAETMPDTSTASGPAITIMRSASCGCCTKWGEHIAAAGFAITDVVTEEMVEQLRPGLNRCQVRYIMGTPLIEDSFHSDRWDYRYLLRNGNETLSETRLTLWFENDELVRAEGPDAPAWGETQSAVDEAAESSAD